MTITKFKTNGWHRQGAFTLIEVLLAMAIMSLLVTAIAVAFNASIKSYNANDDLFKTINLARQAMSRITTQLRSADPCSVDPYAPLNECKLSTQDGKPITYSYNSADKKLYLITNDQDPVRVCENVESLTFKKETAKDATYKDKIYVKNVIITMEIQVGNEKRKFSSAAVNRRNLIR